MEEKKECAIEKDVMLDIDKKFKLLTIQDDFMFCKVMQNKDLCKEC